jgi:hypothetical protein
MKARIRAKTRNRGRDWAIFLRPDEKRVPEASSGSWLEMLVEYILELPFFVSKSIL